MGNGRYPYKIAPGVWARSGQSIQVEFRYRGERCRETFQLDPERQRNRKWAINAREQIRTEIATGRFDYASWFPESPRAILSGAAAVTTIGQLLENYLATLEGTVEWGTYVGYYSPRLHQMWGPCQERRTTCCPGDPTMPLGLVTVRAQKRPGSLAGAFCALGAVIEYYCASL
jgi:hypothetical protein